MMKLKKLIAPLLSCFLAGMALMAALAGCTQNKPSGKEEQQEEKDMVRVVSDGSGIELSNSKIRLRFDSVYGSLISLAESEHELLGESQTENAVENTLPGGNFTLYIDLNAADKWETVSDFSRLKIVTSRSQKLTSFDVENIDGGKKLNLKWDISFTENEKKYEGITVTAEISVFDGSGETRWQYSVENNCSGVTVVSFTCGQLGGIREAENFSLFYPMLEGEIHTNAVQLAKESKLRAAQDGYTYSVKNAQSLSVSYPGSLSMQLLQLFNAERGIYLYSEDDTNEFKRLNFGIFDGTGGYDADTAAGASMSATYYPFLENGEKSACAPLVIGVQGEGGWYAGSDSYRAWKLTTDIRFKNYSETVKNFSGMVAVIATPTNGTPTMAYDRTAAPSYSADMSTTLQDVDLLGFDNMMLLGWNDRGFDTMYPDFKFIEAMGGEAGFKSGVEKIHENGDMIFAYLNAYSVNGDSEWSLAGNWESCAVKDENGNKYTMGWGSSAFTAMCPMSEGYSSALASASERLARNGVNGLFFDQLMEMPATLCYDKTHGHKTPATAYGEGYEKTFGRIIAAMEKYTKNYLFLCEGINDAYIKYVDVAAGMWARPLKYRLNTLEENDPSAEAVYSMPEITRYTIPTKILGLWNYDGSSAEINEHAYAYMMGEPLLRNGGSTNAVMTKLIEVYENYPEIYSQSVYIHSKGFSGEEGLEIGAVVGENSLIVTVYNPTDDDISGSIYFDPETAGLKGRTVSRIEDVLQSGITKRYKDGAFSVDVLSRKFVSYLITLN